MQRSTFSPSATGSSRNPLMQTSSSTLEAPQGNLDQLTKHAMNMQVRVSDLAVRLGQLRDQRQLLLPSQRTTLDAPLAAAEHDFAVARVDPSSVPVQRREPGVITPH